MKKLALAVAPIAVAAVLAGCGSSSKSSSTPATSSNTPATPASTPSAPTATPVVLTTKHLKVGTVLAAGPKKMTVYLFEADKAGKSACSGRCASVWPPVTGSASVKGGAMSANLGTVKRPDGTTQITYKGHPLYYFVKDGDDGDAYGQGSKSFGAEWYVLAPTGSKIDKS